LPSDRQNLLNAAESKATEFVLSFAVVVSGWPELLSWQRLQRSAFLKREPLVLDAIHQATDCSALSSTLKPVQQVLKLLKKIVDSFVKLFNKLFTRL